MSKLSMAVIRRAGRKFYECQWADPVTGRKKTRSTGEKTKREAERFAGKLANEIVSNRYRLQTRTTWDEFRERYELEELPSKAESTIRKASTVFNTVERIINPKLLRSIDATQVSRMQRILREEGCAEATIKGYLTYLAKALAWAKGQDILQEVPTMFLPTRTATMKGRPVTAEEFDRMLAKVKASVMAESDPEADELQQAAAFAVAERVAASWEHLLRGLWTSGLRLGEALNLHWTDDRRLSVDLSGRRPKLRIQAAGQKANRYDETPITPEFFEFLDETPHANRRGYVFNPLPKSGVGRMRRVDVVSSVIVRIGEAAGIRVSERPGRGKTETGEPNPPRTKFASAHDLRRSFGDRWAKRVMPNVLQQLMRHKSINTTLEFYVGRNAEAAADAIWTAGQAVANTFANTAPDAATDDQQKNPQPLEGTRVLESHRSDSN